MEVFGIQNRVGRSVRGPGMAMVVLALATGLAGAQGPAPGATPAGGLQEQVKVLSEALATAHAENDLLKARLDRRLYEAEGGAAGDLMPGGRPGTEASGKVLDVNKGLGIVVLNMGRGQGIRPGMTFAIMQGDRSVATVRVVDARSAIAGAVVETVSAWRYPQAQDRAIRMAGSRE